MEYYNDIKMEDTEGRVGKKNRKGKEKLGCLPVSALLMSLA